MKRFRASSLLVLIVLALTVAVAQNLTVVVNGKSQNVAGFLEKDTAWLSLVPFLQVLGDNARPVKVDVLSSTVTLTKGDGKLQASASIQLKNNTVFVDALTAARGLGFSTSLQASTISLDSQPTSPSVSSTARPLYPKSLDPKLLEPAVKALYDALDSGNADAALIGVLNGSGIAVFGTAARPADLDLLNVYQAMRRSFALSLEVFTLQMGYKYRMFTKLEDFLRGLSERGIAKLDMARLQTGIGSAFLSDKPSRSQAVTAFVAAMGRERVRRGVSVSRKLDPFWGDDSLDPIQLRLLDAVLTNGFALGAIRPKNLGLPSHFQPTRAAFANGIEPPAPQWIQDFFNWVAEKAVDQISKETYPGVKDTIDHGIADAVGVPLPNPLSEEMYNALLKGDFAKVKEVWGNTRVALIKQAIKEGAQVILCGSLILYGYKADMSLSLPEVNHFTANKVEGEYSTKVKLHIEFTDDYHKNIFDKKVITIGGMGFTPPAIENGAILKQLGCDLPEKGVAKGKPVEWELSKELVDHAETGNIIVQGKNNVTNDSGEAQGRFDAVRENVPKAYRLGKYKASVSGGITVTVKDLLPSNWWRIQAAVQFGQSDDKAGTNFKRLRVRYFEFPKLKLEFVSSLRFKGQTEYGQANYNAKLVADVPLKVQPEGIENDFKTKFLLYRGAGSLRYEERHFDVPGKPCRILDVKSGTLEVLAGTMEFESPSLALSLSPITDVPRETIICDRAAQSSVWFGNFKLLHEDAFKRLELPLQPAGLPGFVFTGAQEANPTQTLWQKTFQKSAYQPSPEVTLWEDTQVRVVVQ